MRRLIYHDLISIIGSTLEGYRIEAAVEDFNIRDLDTPRKFKVTITETSKMIVEVEADNQPQTEQMVSDGWHRSEYILSERTGELPRFSLLLSPIPPKLAR